jgi:starch phosphorylase
MKYKEHMADSDPNPFSHVPDRLSGLVDLSYNLWWSWHPEARVLFKRLNPHAWALSVHNPVKMIRDIPPSLLDRALADPGYMRRYDIIMHRFRRYMANQNGWFSSHYPNLRKHTIAYFSAEYGLHHSLPFYAGGLGFLAGDHLKEASDLGVPLVAVGFMYSEGYLHQHIRPDGWQDGIHEILNRDTAPTRRVLDSDGAPIIVRVPAIDPPLYVTVWKVEVGKIPLYLLDTDIAENDPAHRGISSQLYTPNREERLKQEIVLGIGGRKALNEMGISYTALHLNEGHPAFALLEQLRELVEAGASFADAIGDVRQTALFTTHTPVAAGTDVFERSLMDKYLSKYCAALGIDPEEFYALGLHPNDRHSCFNMTVFAMRMTGYCNGVSRRHGEVARGIWGCLWPERSIADVPIGAVTNGVHLPTWLNPRLEDLFNSHIGDVYPRWQEEHDVSEIWELIDEVPDEDLWQTHVWLKMKLINRIRERKRQNWADQRDKPENLVAEGMMLNPSVLTIGIARRFSTYKRADLIFHDPERLKRIVTNPWYPVQVIFAGKAHPADDEGKRVLQRIYQFAQQPAYSGRIAFVEDYGEQMAQYMVHGVDVWLNTPTPPLEACGTSGMKAALNGVLNMSILDGWWPEGYKGVNGWAFGATDPTVGRDAADAAEIYRILEDEVIPLYYTTDMDGIPHGWVAMMKRSIKSIAPHFSARRMMKDYVREYYSKSLNWANSALQMSIR